MLQPGQNFPSEGQDPFAPGYSSTATSEATTTSSTASSTAAAATSSSAAAGGSHHGGLSTGAIAGIAVGSAIVGLMAAALFFLWVRNKSLNKKIKETDAGRQGPQGPVASEQGSYFYGAPPSHMSQPYDPNKNIQDHTSYASSAYSPGLPQYAPQSTMPPIPSEQMSEGMLSPGPTSPLVRPTSPNDRTFTGFSTPPQEVQ